MPPPPRPAAAVLFSITSFFFKSVKLQHNIPHFFVGLASNLESCRNSSNTLLNKQEEVLSTMEKHQ